jgi:16S rRNA (guanine(966)-N(2))-methyltransferase RsmD
MFSMLASMDAVEEAVVLDLFAGSGALGIEALSRGASKATFVDRDRAAIATIRTNLGVLGPAARAASIVCADAVQYLSTAPVVDLVFADPPYGFDAWARLLAGLRDRTTWLVAETGHELSFEGQNLSVEGQNLSLEGQNLSLEGQTSGADWETVKVRRYGGTVVTVVQAAARSKPLVRQEGET